MGCLVPLFNELWLGWGAAQADSRQDEWDRVVRVGQSCRTSLHRLMSGGVMSYKLASHVLVCTDQFAELFHIHLSFIPGLVLARRGFLVRLFLVRFRFRRAFECDDVIRRAHVSRKRERAAGCCIERSLMGCFVASPPPFLNVNKATPQRLHEDSR